ncbi:MAG TPA: adenylate/guanylate cyclase domain-containing protein [Acidimicrobiia bacterium]
MTPETEYAKIDGLRIAYQTVGEGPPDVLLSAGHFNHTDAVWEEPGAALFLRRMAGFCRLIRFDALGSGGSDRPLNADAIPAYDEQIQAVLDAAGSPQAALITMLDAGPAAIEFAAKHPGRVSHLILWNSTARMIRDDDYPEGMDPDALHQLYDAVAEGWASQYVGALNNPSRSDDAAFMTWYRKYMRSIATPTEVQRVLEGSLEQDARPFLAEITMPALVMHRTDYALIPMSQSRYLAGHLARAEFMEVPGADGAVYWETPELILDVWERFLTGDAGRRTGQVELVTLLFTDIVRSTERAEGMGDRNWLAVIDEHNATTLRIVEQNGGAIVKHTGDGTLATFPTPSGAIQAAVALRRALGGMSVEIRIGIHTGEVRRSEADVEGLAVAIAARVMGEAEPGDIMVSRTVRDLTAGSPVRFEAVGARRLRGLTEEWELFRVNP